MAVTKGVLYQHTDDPMLIGANPQNSVRNVSLNEGGAGQMSVGSPQVGSAYLQTSAPAVSSVPATGAQSSFADSGSMKATPVTNGNPTANANGVTPTYSDYMNVQYTTNRPGDFDAGQQPVYNQTYDPRGKSQAYYDAISQPFSYTMPQDYTSRLQSTWDAQLAQAQQAANRQFSYDASTDPVYQAYLKQYAREGQRASANTLGQAAAMTGGRPSSYAVSAASQAGNYYAAQAADKLPELYQQAYNRYLQDYQNRLNLLSAINQRENVEQGIWEGNTNNRWKGIGTDLDIYNNNIQNAYNAAALERSLANDEYEQYLNELNQYNTNRNFNYGQLLNDIDWEAGNEGTTYERAWNEENRDYTRDWNENERDYSRQQDEFNRALQLAQYGDYSALEALGYDTSYIRALNEAQLADQYAQTQARLMSGSGSRSSGGGSGSSGSGTSGLSLDGAPGNEDEEYSEDDYTAEINGRIDSILNAANLKGMAVTNKSDWDFLVEYLGEDWLKENGYKFGEGQANTNLSASQSKQAAYYKQLYPDGIVTNLTDWNAICSLYGNAANAQKTGGFSFVGNYNGTQTEKGATTYNASGMATYDENNREVVGPASNTGSKSNRLMPYQEIVTAAKTGTMPVTTKTMGISTGSASANKSAAGNKSAGSAANSKSTTVTHGGVAGDYVADYDTATKMMADAKIPKTAIEGLLTEEEWTKRKKVNTTPNKVSGKTFMLNEDTGDMSYNTYADYVSAYYDWAINTYKK